MASPRGGAENTGWRPVLAAHVCLSSRGRRDLRYALRTLTRNPSFSIVAIFTLAVGIGANTAISSVVNALMLQPLPYADSERLVRIIENVPPALTPNGRPARAAWLTDEDVRVEY